MRWLVTCSNFLFLTEIVDLEEVVWRLQEFLGIFRNILRKNGEQYFTWWFKVAQITWLSSLRRIFNLVFLTFSAETSVNSIFLGDIWPLFNKNCAQSWYFVLHLWEKWKKSRSLKCFQLIGFMPNSGFFVYVDRLSRKKGNQISY